MDIFKKNSLVLAPMAGVADTVFRQVCKSSGAGIVVSEMVSAEGIKYKSSNTLDLLSFDESERPFGVQLFGADPSSLGDAAKFVQDYAQPDFIDLNAGCPVQKVVKKNGGSALLRDKVLFEKILTAMVKAVSTPVTVKIRSGWVKDEWVDVEFAKIAQGCGVRAITLHPRSRSMGFSGKALWQRIAEVKQAVSVPVIGNGDICTADDALQMLRVCGCDAIMIGRATYGNPWIFSEVKAALCGQPSEPPSVAEKTATIVNHINLYVETHGEDRASKEMKKHLAWYFKGVPGAALFRDRIFRSEKIEHLIETVNSINTVKG